MNVAWTKSSYSSTGADCVQVRREGPDTVIVGDSKLGGDTPELTYPSTEWDRFCDRVAAGHRGSHASVIAEFAADGTMTLAQANTPVLAFTSSEVDAFLSGVRDGELRSTTVQEPATV